MHNEGLNAVRAYGMSYTFESVCCIIYNERDVCVCTIY